MPPADFGAKLFSGLAAEISSDENIGPRRRAYTDMDALLENDIKQNEAGLGDTKSQNKNSEHSKILKTDFDLSFKHMSKKEDMTKFDVFTPIHKPQRPETSQERLMETLGAMNVFQTTNNNSLRNILLQNLAPGPTDFSLPSQPDRRKLSLDISNSKAKMKTQIIKNGLKSKL